MPKDPRVGQVVRAGDGTPVLITEDRGPVTLDGQHYNLDEPTPPETGDPEPVPAKPAVKKVSGK
jgi:hypothetical protein